MASVGTLARITNIHVVPEACPSIMAAVPLVSTDSMLSQLQAELLAVRQVIANVRAHHRVVGIATGSPWCIHDGQRWPCETTRALDGANTPDPFDAA